MTSGRGTCRRSTPLAPTICGCSELFRQHHGQPVLNGVRREVQRCFVVTLGYERA